MSEIVRFARRRLSFHVEQWFLPPETVSNLSASMSIPPSSTRFLALVVVVVAASIPCEPDFEIPDLLYERMRGFRLVRGSAIQYGRVGAGKHCLYWYVFKDNAGDRGRNLWACSVEDN